MAEHTVNEMKNEIKNNKVALGQLITSILTIILFIIPIFFVVKADNTIAAIISNNVVRLLFLISIILFIISQKRARELNKKIKEIDSNEEKVQNNAHIGLFIIAFICFCASFSLTAKYMGPLLSLRKVPV